MAKTIFELIVEGGWKPLGDVSGIQEGSHLGGLAIFTKDVAAPAVAKERLHSSLIRSPGGPGLVALIKGGADVNFHHDEFEFKRIKASIVLCCKRADAKIRKR